MSTSPDGAVVGESGLPANQPSISVVVPAHEGSEELKACLDSLSRLVSPPLEILLVSDGFDAQLDHLASGYPVRLLHLREKKGPAAARNRGAMSANGDILLFIDSDVAVPADLLERVAELYLRFPRHDAFFGSYNSTPGAPDFLSQYRNLLHHHFHQRGRTASHSFWTGCGTIRRSVFLKVGGLDAHQFGAPAIEDVELGHRLIQAGHLIRLCPELQVTHLKRWTAADLLYTDTFRRALPWTLTLLQTGDWFDDLNISWGERINVGLLGGALGLPLFYRDLAVPVLFITPLLLLSMNWRLYAFFARKRGWWFAARVVPWHWAYLCCALVGFGSGCLVHYLMPASLKPASGWTGVDETLVGEADRRCDSMLESGPEEQLELS